MKRYNNLSGNSGIVAYDIAGTSITIKFVDGGTYLYSYVRPGRADVDAMKKLAVSGRGLATYINEHVREKYESKLSR